MLSHQHPVQFDPTNKQHIVAFQQLCIGTPDNTGTLVCSQHPSVRFIIEHPFNDARNMLLYKVGAHYANTMMEQTCP